MERASAPELLVSEVSTLRHDRKDAEGEMLDTEQMHSSTLARDSIAPAQRDEHDQLLQRIREEKVDYGFHKMYKAQRVLWQNNLIRRILAGEKRVKQNGTTPPKERAAGRRPWVIFTGGPMGVGKGHVVKYLWKSGSLKLPLVPIDPDRIRRAMPEWKDFVARVPMQAGALTHKEAGLIAEIATEAALRLGKDVWVDGSLRDADWVKSSIADIRARFPEYLIGVVFVTASREKILERVERRGRDTGRLVPSEKIDASIHGSLITVNSVASDVDLLLTFDNDNDNADPALVGVETRGVRRAVVDICEFLRGVFEDERAWIQPWAELAETSRRLERDLANLR